MSHGNSKNRRGRSALPVPQAFPALTLSVLALLLAGIALLNRQAPPTPRGAAAASISRAGARRARNRHGKPRLLCVSQNAGKRRLTLCSAPGPAGRAGATGGMGPRGFVGLHGGRGYTGPRGATGPTGATGSARAYALVSMLGTVAEPGQPVLVAAQTMEFTEVHRVGEGTYCLTPGPAAAPASTAAVVSGESSYSAPGVIPYATLIAIPAACAGGQFEVRTYDLAKVEATGPTGPTGLSAPKASNAAAFTIAVP